MTPEQERALVADITVLKIVLHCLLLNVTGRSGDPSLLPALTARVLQEIEVWTVNQPEEKRADAERLLKRSAAGLFQTLATSKASSSSSRAN